MRQRKLVYAIAVGGAFFGTLIGAESAKASPSVQCQTNYFNDGRSSTTYCMYGNGEVVETNCYSSGDCFTHNEN